MPLDHCATGLRIIAATLLEAAPISHDDSVDRRDRVLASITSLADRIRGPAPLLGMLGTLIKLVEDTIEEDPNGPLTQALNHLLEQFRAHGEANRCSHCAGRPGPPMCAKLRAGATDGGAAICIREVVELLEDLEQRAREVYHQHSKDAKSTSVAFSLQSIARGAEHGFIPDFHVNGATTASGAASVVEIVFEERTLDLRTLRQLYYVGAHELICHAFQGVENPQRVNVGASCSWSEGWMDAVAWQLLERWLNEPDGMPDWLARSPTPRRAIDDCRKLHDRRYQGRQGRVMDPENIYRRQQARDACDALYRHWCGPRFNRRLLGLRKIVKFSVALNVAPLDRNQREDLIIKLVSGLLLSDCAVSATLAACEDFLVWKDCARLFKSLDVGAGAA